MTGGNLTSVCPCGSGLALEACCGRFHRGAQLPTTPEQLMRSRYAAFHLSEVDYLLATSHPVVHGPRERAVLEQACRSTRWLALRILDAPAPTGDVGEVEFVAFHRAGPSVGQLHERSRFVREGGCWLYRSGRILPALSIGRNDPCWCGSGAKRKACHG